MRNERSEALVGLWRRVNEIACSTEDGRTIRALIAEAGIQPGVHVGVEPADFTDDMVAEWVLGQWADMIDSGSPFLNSARNISMHNYEKLHGKIEVEPVGGKEWFADEIRAVASGGRGSA